ncbi:MAG TPA: ATP-binding protein [bacterium]|nr:ATP-binding protein [bacterium]
MNKTSLLTWLLCLCFASAQPGDCFSSDTTMSPQGAAVGVLSPLSEPGQTIYDFAVQDFNRDGFDEVACLRRDTDHPLFLVIRELAGGAYSFPGRPLPAQGMSQYLFALTGHPRYRWLLYRTSLDHGSIYLFDHTFQFMDSLRAPGHRDGNRDGLVNVQIYDAQIVDSNNDNRLELFLSLNTGADVTPRALLWYDLMERKLIREYPVAPMVNRTRWVDLEGDGFSELVLTLSGASDGPFFAPFSRDSSYLAVLDQHGGLRYSKAFDGASSYVVFDVFDVTGDQVLDVVYASYSLRKTNTGRSRLGVVDGRTLTQQQEFFAEELGEDLRSVTILPSPTKRQPYLYVSTSERLMARFRFQPSTGRLAADKRVPFGGRPELVFSDDLNEDGSAELFITSQYPNQLTITDAGLRPLGRIDLPDSETHRFVKVAPVSDKDREVRSYCLLVDQRLWLLRVSLPALFPTSGIQAAWAGHRLKLPWAVFGLLCLPIIFLPAFLLWKFVLRTPDYGLALMSESKRLGIALLDRQAVLRDCNSHFLRITDLVKSNIIGRTLPEILDNAQFSALLEAWRIFISRNERQLQKEINIGPAMHWRTVAVEIVRTKHNHSRMLLIDLSESNQTERIKIWAAMAQRMAHKIKTPLATVLLAVQRLQRNYRKQAPHLSESFDSISRQAIQEIERVKDVINSFIKFAKLEESLFIEVDFTSVVQEGLNEYLSRLPEGVELQTAFASAEMPTRIDVKQFKEALHNVLDNAVDAVHGEGVIMLSTMLERNPLQAWGGVNWAVLEVRDSGAGIARENENKLFQPGFTTRRDGSGLGLIFVKQIVENHGGEVSITSAPNQGATVLIRLPIIYRTDVDEQGDRTGADRR